IARLLRDGSAVQRLTGLWAVESIGAPAWTPATSQAATDLTRDPDDRVALAARRALVEFGAPLPPADERPEGMRPARRRGLGQTGGAMRPVSNPEVDYDSLRVSPRPRRAGGLTVTRTRERFLRQRTGSRCGTRNSLGRTLLDILGRHARIDIASS